MKYFKIRQLLCKLGIHRKRTFTNSGEVNWNLITVEVTKCTKCGKFF